jgi:hypothetical protein
MTGFDVVINRYKQSLADVATRRTMWANTTKDLVKRILGGVVERYFQSGGWTVEENSDSRNMESVFLRETTTPSGVITSFEGGMRNLARHGAVLSYSQLPNGYLFVHFQPHYIDEVEEGVSSMKIAITDPRHLDQVQIEGHVGAFFDSLTKKNDK